MASVEERVAYLEGRMEDHAVIVTDLRNGIRELRDETVRQFEALDDKVDRHFTWLVGIQVASLVAVVGALVGSYYR